jgi:hypothetical protein
MTQPQLYKASVLSGLKSMTWAEFSGLTMGVTSPNGVPGIAEPTQGLSGVGAMLPLNAGAGNILTPGVQLVPTVGSVVILNFAEVIQLTEEYYAPGSLGSFNLQVAVTVVNNQAEAWTQGQWELFIVPMNSGIFVNERGASSVYTALLTEQDVLETSVQEHYSHGTVKRMIGGGFLNSLKSAMGWISSKLPHVRNALGKIDRGIGDWDPGVASASESTGHAAAKIGGDHYGRTTAPAAGGLGNTGRSARDLPGICGGALGGGLAEDLDH